MATNPFDAVVKKYSGISAPAPEIPLAPEKPGTPASGYQVKQVLPPSDPFSGVVQKYKQTAFDEKQAGFAAEDQKIQEEAANPGIVRGIIDTAKGLPGAAKEIATEAVTHPIKTGQSVVLGLMDVGPAIVNFLSSLGTGMLKALPGPAGENAQEIKLPKPGQTFFDYVNESSEAQKAIRTGSEQFAGYELGQAAVKPLATTPLARNVLGNVAGGQVVSEAETLKDRAKQAAFDAAFGVVETGVGALAGKVKGKLASNKAFNSAMTEIRNSEAFPIQKTIDSGDMPRSAIYQGDGDVLTPNFAKGRIDDVAQKLDRFQPGLGDAYRSRIDVNAATMKNIVDTGVDVLEQARAGTFPDLPTPKAAEGVIPKTDVADVVYKPKANLGKDAKGDPILATTEFDAKTGRAIVYYKKSLDADPKLRDAVFNHEEGHIFDKRVNAGSNLSSEIRNFTGNQVNLENILGPVAKQLDEPVDVIAKKMSDDILTLSGGEASTPAETFANAFAKFRENPAAAKEIAPTFSAFVESVPVPATSRFSTRSVTESVIKNELDAAAASPRGEKPLEVAKPTPKPQEAVEGQIRGQKELKKPEAPAELKPLVEEARARKVAKPEPKPELTTTQKEQIRFKDRPERQVLKGNQLGALKGIPPDNLVHFNQGANPRVSLIVSAEDKALIEIASKLQGLKSSPAQRRTAGEQLARMARRVGLSEKEMKQYAFDTYDSYRAMARANAEKSSPVVLNTIKKPSAETLKFAEAPAPVAVKETPRKLKPKTEEVTLPSGEKPRPVTKAPEVPAKEPASGRIASTGLKTNKGVKTSSFNPSKINAPDEVVDLFRSMEKTEGNFKKQRLSKGNEDIKDLARLTGLTEDELVNAAPGSIANSETVTAARQLVINKANELMQTLKGTDVSAASPAELQKIRDDFLKLVSMQKTVAGFRTEASNVFRSLGIELAPGENATLAELAGILKKEGLASEGDAAIFASKVAKQFQLSKLEKVREGVLNTWYAAILSGPKTTLRNIVSTGANIATELASKATNPKQWRELMPAVSGLLKGLKEGVGEAKEVLSSGGTSKFELGESGVMKPPVFTGKFSKYGQVVESVGRFLNAQDKFLSAGAREMERAGLKVSTPEVSSAVTDAISKAYAERTVYHGRPTGKIIGGLRDAAQTLRRKYPESKFIIPFVDTVANVMDRQFDYIPVTAALRLRQGVINEQAERIAKDFGITSKADVSVIAQRLRDQQIGRLALGTSVSGAAMVLAGAGRISGSGPTNYNERQQLMRTGWRPNSIKVGDTWVPYTYLGPLGGIFSMVGNIHDKTKYDKAPNKTVFDLISKGLVGWSQTQLDMSFLSGTADIFDVLSGNKSPDKWLTDLGVGLVPVPALYSQTKDMIFRQQYETRGFVEKIRDKLGLEGDVFGEDALEPRLDVYGEPMRSDLIYGLWPSKEKAPNIDNFLTANDLVIGKPLPSQEYAIPGKKKEKRSLTAEEYTRYIQQSGKEIYQELNRRLPGFQNMTHDQQKKTIENLVEDIRTRTRRQIMLGQK